MNTMGFFFKATLSALFITSSSAVASSVGAVHFSNLDAAAGLDVPIYYSFFPSPGQKLGPDYVAELLIGPTVNTMVGISFTRFYDGYFDGGVVDIQNMSPGSTAWCVVQTWNSRLYGSFARAYASNQGGSCGASNPFRLFSEAFQIPRNPYWA